MWPAAFGRLRVETAKAFSFSINSAPAAFGRLRVETLYMVNKGTQLIPSRLRAAAC